MTFLCIKLVAGIVGHLVGTLLSQLVEEGGRGTGGCFWLCCPPLPTFAHLCPPLGTCDHSAMLGHYSSIAVPGLRVVGTSVHLAAVLLGRHQDVKGRPLEEKTSATNPLLIGQDINPSLCGLEWAFRFLVRFGFGTCHRLGLG